MITASAMLREYWAV